MPPIIQIIMKLNIQNYQLKGQGHKIVRGSSFITCIFHCLVIKMYIPITQGKLRNKLQSCVKKYVKSRT